MTGGLPGAEHGGAERRFGVLQALSKQGAGSVGSRGQGWAALLAVGLVLAPRPAFAHLVSTRFGELYGGLLHPLLSLAHVVPWIALGLLGGLQPARTARWASLVLPSSAALGALLGAGLPSMAWVAWVNAGSFVLLGGLTTASVSLSRPAFVALAAAVGLSHGLANANAELAGGPQALYVLGVALAAYALITLVTAAALAARQRLAWGSIALRAAGSWVVAIGLIFSGFRLLSERGGL